MNKKDYYEGFKDGLQEAFNFLYTKVGSVETVRETIERFREMQKKALKEVRDDLGGV